MHPMFFFFFGQQKKERVAQGKDVAGDPRTWDIISQYNDRLGLDDGHDYMTLRVRGKVWFVCLA